MDDLEKVRGAAMLGADEWENDDKVDMFMAIFHPDHASATDKRRHGPQRARKAQDPWPHG